MNRFGDERKPLLQRAAAEILGRGTTRIDTALALMNVGVSARAIVETEIAVAQHDNLYNPDY